MNDSAIFGMLGLLIGGAGVWMWMRARVAVLQEDLRLRPYTYAELNQMDERSNEFLVKLVRQSAERAATISRLSDTVGQLQDKSGAVIEYCKGKVRVRSSVVEGILKGERK